MVTIATLIRIHTFSSHVRRLFLSPLNQSDDGNNYLNGVHVHRSRNKEENAFLYDATSKLIDARNGVRRTKGWNGDGKMVGIGEHLDRKGNHCNFVINPKLRNQWSNEAEKTMMNKCGIIFKKHFGNKPVGFKEMIQQ